MLPLDDCVLPADMLQFGRISMVSESLTFKVVARDCDLPSHKALHLSALAGPQLARGLYIPVKVWSKAMVNTQIWE